MNLLPDRVSILKSFHMLLLREQFTMANTKADRPPPEVSPEDSVGSSQLLWPSSNRADGADLNSAVFILSPPNSPCAWRYQGGVSDRLG